MTRLCPVCAGDVRIPEGFESPDGSCYHGAFLASENHRLGVLLDLIDSRTGWTMLGQVQKRLDALTVALNKASRLKMARRWMRRKLHPDAEPLYSEAMSNMAGAVAHTAAYAVSEGRFAAAEHETNERLRAGITEALSHLRYFDHTVGPQQIHVVPAVLALRKALDSDETDRGRR